MWIGIVGAVLSGGFSAAGCSPFLADLLLSLSFFLLLSLALLSFELLSFELASISPWLVFVVFASPEFCSASGDAVLLPAGVSTFVTFRLVSGAITTFAYGWR